MQLDRRRYKENKREKIGKQVRMAKVDIKDFYQQGDQSEIARKAFSDHNKKIR